MDGWMGGWMLALTEDPDLRGNVEEMKTEETQNIRNIEFLFSMTGNIAEAWSFHSRMPDSGMV
jgi:hypothetical protein